MKLIYEKSQAGRRASALPQHEPAGGRGPGRAAPRGAAAPAGGAELELVRHFTELSTRNFGIDTGFYPLGSCTMKYNPRDQRAARRRCPASRDLHPLQEEDGAQGALELMWRLQEILAEVTGLDAVSLQPAAGSQGELTGLMLVRAYFADRGEAEQRRKVVIPDTRARHEPRVGDDGGLRADAGQDRRARQHRRRRPARQGRRAHGGADAHEPVDARPLRREHRGDRADLPRRRRAHVLRRREPERGVRHLAAGRHGLRHRPHQPAQDVLAAARRRRAGRRADRGARHPRAVPAGAGGRPRGRRRLRARLRPAADDRQGARLHRAVRRLRPLVRVHPHVRAAAARDVGGRGAERELPARAAEGRVRPAVRPALHARVRPLGADAEARARRAPRSTSRSG